MEAALKGPGALRAQTQFPTDLSTLQQSLLLVPELDVDNEKAKCQDDAQRRNDAESRVDRDVYSIGLDPDDGAIFGGPVTAPKDLATPLQVQGASHSAVLSDALFTNLLGLFADP